MSQVTGSVMGNHLYSSCGYASSPMDAAHSSRLKEHKEIESQNAFSRPTGIDVSSQGPIVVNVAQLHSNNGVIILNSNHLQNPNSVMVDSPVAQQGTSKTDTPNSLSTETEFAKNAPHDQLQYTHSLGSGEKQHCFVVNACNQSCREVYSAGNHPYLEQNNVQHRHSAGGSSAFTATSLSYIATSVHSHSPPISSIFPASEILPVATSVQSQSSDTSVFAENGISCADISTRSQTLGVSPVFVDSGMSTMTSTSLDKPSLLVSDTNGISCRADLGVSNDDMHNSLSEDFTQKQNICNTACHDFHSADDLFGLDMLPDFPDFLQNNDFSQSTLTSSNLESAISIGSTATVFSTGASLSETGSICNRDALATITDFSPEWSYPEVCFLLH